MTYPRGHKSLLFPSQIKILRLQTYLYLQTLLLDLWLYHFWASLVAQLVKNPPAMRETWVGRSSGEGNGYPLQYSDLENTIDCTVHGVAKNRTWLTNVHFHFIGSPQDNVVHSSFCWYSQSCSVSILKKVNGPLKLIPNKKAPSSLIIWGIILKRLLWLGNCTCDLQETSFQHHLGCTHLLS